MSISRILTLCLRRPSKHSEDCPAGIDLFFMPNIDFDVAQTRTSLKETKRMLEIARNGKGAGRLMIVDTTVAEKNLA